MNRVMAPRPKYDYDSDKFYEEIQKLAYIGLTDKAIAEHLDLNPDTFGAMKNGYYAGWNEEENELRSNRICRVLANGRKGIVSALRSTYVKMALGQHKSVTKSVTKRAILNPDGSKSNISDLSETETEIGYPPSLQALSVLLRHYDSDWKKLEDENNDNDIPPLDIEEEVWLKENSNEITTDAEDTDASGI